jgi:hypothetical protein
MSLRLIRVVLVLFALVLSLQLVFLPGMAQEGVSLRTVS